MSPQEATPTHAAETKGSERKKAADRRFALSLEKRRTRTLCSGGRGYYCKQRAWCVAHTYRSGLCFPHGVFTWQKTCTWATSDCRWRSLFHSHGAACFKLHTTRACHPPYVSARLLSRHSEAATMPSLARTPLSRSFSTTIPYTQARSFAFFHSFDTFTSRAYLPSAHKGKIFRYWV